MTKYQWFDGNQGFFGYDRFDDYLTTSSGSTGMVLSYDAAGAGPLDPSIHAASIAVSFSNYKSTLIDEGPFAGQQQVTGGIVSAIRYYDANNLLLLEVTNANAPLPIFLAALARGDAYGAWHLVTRTAGIQIGSRDASTLIHAATGDVIDTGVGIDHVRAAGGDDFIQDRGGADRYVGGVGFDTLSYGGWYFTPYAITRGITADLMLGTVDGPDGGLDSITGIEAVNGTFLADVMAGSAGNNIFVGFAGGDRFDGRGGFDKVNYSLDQSQGGTDGIRANLALGTVRDGFGYTDLLISIEGIQGTSQRDILLDDGFGNDFAAGGGNDTLRFSFGNDTASGGSGADMFIYRSTSFGDDLIRDFTPGDGDMILIEEVVAFSQLVMTNFITGGQPAVFIRCGFGTLTLLGVATTDLSPGDFGL